MYLLAVSLFSFEKCLFNSSCLLVTSFSIVVFELWEYFCIQKKLFVYLGFFILKAVFRDHQEKHILSLGCIYCWELTKSQGIHTRLVFYHLNHIPSLTFSFGFNDSSFCSAEVFQFVILPFVLFYCVCVVSFVSQYTPLKSKSECFMYVFFDEFYELGSNSCL